MSSTQPSRETIGKVLVIDHRDSFVFMLVDHFARGGYEVRTLRSDIGLADLQAEVETHRPSLVLLSPGPGRPEQSGVMVPFLKTEPRVPVLGVCLGHQAMAVAAGGEVGLATDPVHGRSCVVRHHGDAMFEGIPSRFTAARYHSLAVTGVPDCFEVLAETDSEPQLVMAMRHRELPYVGLQFHPESVLTPFGGRLIANLLKLSESRSSKS